MATLRRERSLTQPQLAERLEVTQQQIASYGVGRRRVPVSFLTPLGEALAVRVEALLGAEPESKKRGPAPKLQRHVERIHKLPKARQRLVLEMLDTALQHDGR